MIIDSEQKILIENWFSSKNIDIPSDFISQVSVYCNEIESYSKKMNIISKNDLQFLVKRHVLDSLSPIRIIPKHGKLVDVGSGGGFPGIPLALVFPELEVTLVESRGKKVLFLKNVVSKLNLKNVNVWEGRIENYEHQSFFDVATLRAVSPTKKVISAIKKTIKPNASIIYYNKIDNYIFL